MQNFDSNPTPTVACNAAPTICQVAPIIAEASSNCANAQPPSDSKFISQAEFDSLPVCEQLPILKAEVVELDRRVAWQARIHRNVLPTGNITHWFIIKPTLVVAAITGFGIALGTVLIVNHLKKS